MLGMQFTRENIIPSRRACRSLFGPVDHDEVKKTLAREMDVLDNRQKAQWNFDFKNEVPLAGRFHWERVTPDSTRVPVAYKVMLRHLEPKPVETSADEEVLSATEEPEQPEESTTSTVETTTITEVPSSPLLASQQQQLENETTPPTLSRKRKRSGQCTMTDFYPVTKAAKTEEDKH